MRLSGICWLLIVLVAACTTEVDLSQLTFATGDVTQSEDQGNGSEFIHCSRYVECALERGGESGFATCLQEVRPEEIMEAEALDMCRMDMCSVPAMNPDSGAFDPAELLDCLFKLCPDTAVECAVWDGTDTCLPFAVGWKNVNDGEKVCNLDPQQLCYFELLENVSPDFVESTKSLLSCLHLYIRGFQEFDAHCLPFCM